MESLKIQIPNGFKVDSFDKKTGELKFKEIPKKVTERIKTIQDVLDDNRITEGDIDKMFSSAPNHLKHQFIIELLVRSLNEGWVPDWNNSSEYKYQPCFKMGSSGFRFNDYDYWFATSYVGSRLCFKSSKLAKYAGEQFREVYKQFMII